MAYQKTVNTTEEKTEKKVYPEGVFPFEKDEAPIAMFVNVDDMNPQNKYAAGSINGVQYQYETGSVYNMPYNIAEAMFYCGTARPVKKK